MQIVNRQTYTITEESNTVTVTEADIRECREYEDDPYTGECDQDFLEYVWRIIEDGDSFAGYPDIIYTLYYELVGRPTRNQVKCSLDQHGGSELEVYNDDGDCTGSLEASM